MESIRVVLADDHAILRDSLSQWLALQPDILVVGEADDGREAVALAEELRPDVCVMDVSMPGLSGIEATRRLAQGCSKVHIIAVTQHSDPDTVAAMLEAGAMGYVVKSDGVDELLRAVRVVAGGRRYLSPSLSDYLAEPFLQHHRCRGSLGEAAELTSREREVVQMIAEGLSTRQIAEVLDRSIRTVEAHRHNIMSKLEIKTIAGLTKWAIRNRLTSIDA